MRHEPVRLCQGSRNQKPVERIVMMPEQGFKCQDVGAEHR